MNNKNLTLQELEFVQNEVVANKKSIWGAYALTFLLWPIGVGRAYLGKRKSALVRIALTLSMIGIVAVMMNFSLNLEAEEIAKQLVSSTAIAMSLVITSLISLIMLIVELISIPKWVKEIDENSWEEATDKAIKGRYVSEQLLKDNLSQFLIDEIKSEVEEKINEETKSLVEELKSETENKIKKETATIINSIKDYGINEDKLVEEDSFDENNPEKDDPIEEIDKYLNISTAKEEAVDNKSEEPSKEPSKEPSEEHAKNNYIDTTKQRSKNEESNYNKKNRRNRKKIVRRKKIKEEIDVKEAKEAIEKDEFLSMNQASKGTPIGELLEGKDVDLSSIK